MNRSANKPQQVQGTVKPGFDSVKQVYAREIQMIAEKNTQLCVYYKGERVVDLWASADDDRIRRSRRILSSTYLAVGRALKRLPWRHSWGEDCSTTRRRLSTTGRNSGGTEKGI
jgi:hypothetical protein